jgi:hypothetical protein
MKTMKGMKGMKWGAFTRQAGEDARRQISGEEILAAVFTRLAGSSAAPFLLYSHPSW